VTIAAELGNISSRFETARNLMGYKGAFPSEDSRGIQRSSFPKVFPESKLQNAIGDEMTMESKLGA
jgi:hypothetical protein